MSGFAAADIVAPSSNHREGLQAQAPLTTAANTAIAHGSSNLPGGRAGAGSSTSSATRCSTVGMDMMLVTVKLDRGVGSQIAPANSPPASAFREKLRYATLSASGPSI